MPRMDKAGSLLTAPAHAENRTALRRSVRMRAHLRDRGTTRFEIDVLDLSTTGFRAQTSFSLWPGATVWITLPGLSGLESTVAWREQTLYGCAFTKPLYPAVFEHIVALANG